MYDIIIIGAGPAGLTAAIYARRAEKQVLVIEKDTFGGQITHSPRVENYPGFSSVSGNELADRLIEQTIEQGAMIELDEVTGIEGTPGDYTVKGVAKDYKARAVIIASGSHHRRLGLDGEERLTGEGISYCAVCDGAFYRGQTVAVIGGGNSALQDAVMLSDGCEKVYVVQNLPYLTGEERLQKILADRPQVEIICSSVVERLVGNESLRAIEILNTESGERRSLSIDGMFVAIGQCPENEPFASVTELNGAGYITADESCVPVGSPDGIFAAGDCRTKSVRQVTTATADGAVAALAAIRFIDSLSQ
ncbi:MAG: FAD-dependent oxidoreductase [Clostridia bacterium]|nr:FAD-dependent oxidoreductase [Clostridia bacterium]